MGLTLRELQVLNLASTGRSDKEIGEELELAENTVKTHMKNAFVKLRARNRTHAVALCLRAGLFE